MKRKLTQLMLKTIALFLVMLQVIMISAAANDNVLSLYKNKPEDNTPFNVVDMFPGDYITQDYNVRVSYNGTIKVYFGVDIKSDSEKLAEVLMCKVVMPDENKLLYDGLMRDMPDLEHTISEVNTTEDLKYEISVYLDTSVGNDYQDKRLVANFKWWAYTSDEGHPGGGGGIPIVPEGPDTPPGGGDDDDPVIPPDDGDNDPITPPGDDDEPTAPPDDGDDNPTTPPGSGDDPITPPGEGDDPTSPTTPDTPIPPESENVPPGEGERPSGELIDPPNTGDLANPVLWIILICISLFVILLIIFLRKKNKSNEDKNPIIKKLTICIVIIIILAICLCITTFALVYSKVTVDDNTFKTGTVKINLNDRNPIITEKEYLFEPGMTVEKEFFIKNESSEAVFYKIYFDNVKGGLAKVLEVKILDKETGEELYSGKAGEFKRENCNSAELLLNEKRFLTAVFHYPKESGNATKNMELSFDMCAVATQTSNNTGREFN